MEYYIWPSFIQEFTQQQVLKANVNKKSSTKSNMRQQTPAWYKEYYDSLGNYSLKTWKLSYQSSTVLPKYIFCKSSSVIYTAEIVA